MDTPVLFITAINLKNYDNNPTFSFFFLFSIFIKKYLLFGKNLFFKRRKINKKEKKRGDASLRIYGYWCCPLGAVDDQARVTVDTLDGRDLHG